MKEHNVPHSDHFKRLPAAQLPDSAADEAARTSSAEEAPRNPSADEAARTPSTGARMDLGPIR